MGRKLTNQEAELYKRCDEVLHYIWDPIGVSGSPGARDEYHSYLPQVFARVRENAEPGDIARFLTEVETLSMGLRANDEHALEVAEVLLEWREWIWENDTPQILGD